MEPLKDNWSSVFALLVRTALLCVAIAIPFIYTDIESARALRARNDSVEVDFRQMLLYYDVRPKTRAESLQIGLLGRDKLRGLPPAARAESLQFYEEWMWAFLARSERATADSMRRVQHADSLRKKRQRR
jgi:hypothetical protein